VRTAVWLLPASRGKNRFLRRLGDDIAPSAILHPNLIRHVDSISIGPGARIGMGNVIKHLRVLRLGPSATIGRYSLISAHPVYRRLLPDGARLELAERAAITSRHTLDCAGSVLIHEGAMVAGHSSTVLTHSIDLKRDAQTAYPVEIGAYSFVGAHCLMLGGARLPDHSVLAAGSVLPRAKGQEEPGLWAGVPATRRGEVDGAWFSRTATGTRRVYVPATGEVVEDAF
jgi:acetyltransferase-like isoleucine patch superfamily enzyme